jgi:hypothetical protein
VGQSFGEIAGMDAACPDVKLPQVITAANGAERQARMRNLNMSAIIAPMI